MYGCTVVLRDVDLRACLQVAAVRIFLLLRFGSFELLSSFLLFQNDWEEKERPGKYH